MGTIGNLAVGLSLNPTDYLSGLDRAGRKMEAFGRDVGKFALLPANALRGLSALPVRAVDGVLGPIKSLLTSLPLVGFAFAAIPASGAEFTSWIRGTIGEMAEMVKTSQKVGISVAGMSALMVGAQLGPEELTKNLNHLSRELGSIQAGDKDATNKFGKLGFDPQQLAGQGTEGALRIISDRMAELHSGTEKAKLAFDIFGKSGADLIPLLSKGSAGLDAAAVKAKQLGLSFGDVDGKNILEANRAFGSIGLTITGIGRQIAINLAPYIAAAGKGFMDWATSGRSVGDIVLDVIGNIVTGIGYVGDAWNVVKGIFTAGSGVIVAAIGTLADNFASLIEMVSKVPGGGFLKGAAEDARNFAKAIQHEAGDLFNQADKSIHAPSQGAAFKSWLDGIKNSAKAAGKSMGDAGTDAKSLAEAAKHFDLMQKGVEITKELATPLETFQTKIDELNALAREGAISWEVYARGVDKATDALDANQKENMKGPEALTAGSAAAMKAINEANRTSDKGSVQERIKTALDQQLAKQDRANALAEQMLGIWDNLGLANLGTAGS